MISDQKITVYTGTAGSEVLSHYAPDVIAQNDYYPFGIRYVALPLLHLPNRHEQGDQYRYGFQGQEKDDEVYGSEGTSSGYKYRMHSPRVGRFLSIDPLARKFAYNSPYAFSENKVIRYTEFEGLEVQDPMAVCDDAFSEPRGFGLRGLFKRKPKQGIDKRGSKFTLITKEVVYERAIVCTYPIEITEPEPGLGYEADIYLGNSNENGNVAVDWDMYSVKDILIVTDIESGEEYINTGPVKDVGSENIPAGANAVHISVQPEIKEGNAFYTEYDLSLNYREERVFKQTTTKFLGITISRKVIMLPEEKSRKLVDTRNNDIYPKNDIPWGDNLKNEYERKNGPIPCDCQTPPSEENSAEEGTENEGN